MSEFSKFRTLVPNFSKRISDTGRENLINWVYIFFFLTFQKNLLTSLETVPLLKVNQKLCKNLPIWIEVREGAVCWSLHAEMRLRLGARSVKWIAVHQRGDSRVPSWPRESFERLSFTLKDREVFEGLSKLLKVVAKGFHKPLKVKNFTYKAPCWVCWTASPVKGNLLPCPPLRAELEFAPALGGELVEEELEELLPQTVVGIIVDPLSSSNLAETKTFCRIQEKRFGWN